MHFDFSVKFLMSLMLAPVSVYGGQPDSVSSHTNIPEVVVTGEKHAPVPTTNTSQTLSLKKSDRLVLQNVSDAVRRMAGAEIKDYGGIGGLKTVSVRGLGSKHTLVCYDGMPVTDCQNGQVDLGRFSLDQLDEIQLYIGEDCDIDVAASYFASTSVLNLMSSAPIYSDKNYNAVAKIAGGSFGFVNPYVSFDHKLGDHNSIKASANFSRADGNYPYTLTNGTLKTEERREHSESVCGHGELSGRFLLSPKTHLRAKTHYYVSDRELPGGVIFYNTESNETLKDKNAFAEVVSRTDWGSRTVMKIGGKFNWNASYYHDEAMMYPGGKLDNRYFQREWYGKAVVRHNFTEHFSMANATDYILNSFNSNIHGCVFPQRHTLLDALSGKFKNEKVTATATLLGSFFFNQVEIGEAPDNYQHLSPSIAVSYKPFAPSIYFRASYKNIFRMPNFNELYFNSFGVRTLEPEKTEQYNVGATYLYEADKSLESSRLKSFAISADYYFNKVDDKIVAMPKMFIWSIVNMGYVEIKGIDFVTNLEVATSKRTSLFLTAKYAYQYAVDLTDPKSDIYEHQLPYIPKHSGNGSVAFENPVVNVSYNVNAVGKRYYLPQNIRPNMMEAYAEHGVSLYKTFDFEKFDMKLRGDVVNLTDKQYEVVRFYPMPKRSYKASVEFKF